MDQLVRLDNQSEGRSFFHLDGLRSTVSLTTDAGDSRQSMFYDAWGNERDRIGTSTNNFTFTGHEKDEETGLIYAKARFYDADVGRFLHQDTELGEGSVPPSLHLYSYAFQNPLRFVDPNGHQSLAAAAEEEGRRRAAVAEARASGVLPSEGLKAETAGLGGQVFTEEAQVPDRPDQFMHDADTQRELGRVAQAVEAERESARRETVITEEQALMDTVNDPALTALLFQRRDTARAIRNIGAVGGFVGETYIVVAAGTVGDLVILATGKDLNEREASRWLAAGAIILVGVSVAEIQALNRADDQLRGTSHARPKEIRTGQERALAGRPAEEKVSQATGVPRNVGHGRQTVHGTGTAGIRIPDLKVFGPDASLSIRGSIIEVKDVTRLSGTRQIRDLAAEAQKLGGRLEIFTRGNTRIPKTGVLADLIESGAVVIGKIPGT
jgi:RHS repeat-associated protein